MKIRFKFTRITGKITKTQSLTMRFEKLPKLPNFVENLPKLPKNYRVRILEAHIGLLSGALRWEKALHCSIYALRRNIN